MTTQPPSTRQVLLGIFIIGQLCFLISTNLIGFAKDNRTAMPFELEQVVEAVAPGWTREQGHAWNLTEHIAKTDRMWAQVTGQTQYWMLFAPTIARDCVFPAIELRWDDRAELVLSENEPESLDEYFRLGNYRLRRYESNLTVTLRPLRGETPPETAERWREKIRTFVTDYADILDGYLRWRTQRAMQRWPDRPRPREVVLIMRRYHISDYDEAPPYWTGPHTVPIVRWRQADNKNALEWRDPVSGNFKSVAP